MKTFKDLKIGDIIYQVETGYKAAEGPQLDKISVTSLKLEKGILKINERRGYSDTYYLINKDISDLDCDTIRNDNGYLTTNEEYVKQGLKEVGMQLIKGHEASIKSHQEKIKEVRVLYSKYLNYR